MTLLSLDTESCGIGLDFPLLTLTAAVVDENFEHKEVLDIKVKPNPVNGRTCFNVQSEALRVNKIDLGQHELDAMTYDDAKPVIYRWLQEAHANYGTLTPFGNNIGRDIRLVTHYTISDKSFHNFADRRVIDLISIGQTLKLFGLIPQEQSLGLGQIAEFLGVEVDKSLTHTALYDTMLGTKLYEKYCKLLRGN